MSSVGTLPGFQTHPGNRTLCNLSPLVFQTALQLAHTTAWKSGPGPTQFSLIHSANLCPAGLGTCPGEQNTGPQGR